MKARKFATLVTALAVSAMLPAAAQAQDAGLHLLSQDSQFGMQAGININIPLGATSADAFRDRAQVRLALSSVRSETDWVRGTRNRLSHDILALGFDQALQPRLSLHGTDISYRAFPRTYADEVEDEPKSDGSSTALLIVGGIVVGAAAGFAIWDEIEDDVSDTFR